MEETDERRERIVELLLDGYTRRETVEKVAAEHELDESVVWGEMGQITEWLPDHAGEPTRPEVLVLELKMQRRELYRSVLEAERGTSADDIDVLEDEIRENMNQEERLVENHGIDAAVVK